MGKSTKQYKKDIIVLLIRKGYGWSEIFNSDYLYSETNSEIREFHQLYLEVEQLISDTLTTWVNTDV